MRSLLARLPLVPLVLLAQAGCRPMAELPVLAEIDEVRLTTSLGRDFSTASLDGRVHLVDFIFTSCQAACPVMTAKMKQYYDDFGQGEDVRFLSVSTDPDRDTVDVLHEYAENLGVDESRWIFARAEMDEVKRLSEKEFLLAAAGFPIGHSQRFVLVDRERQIRGYYDSADSADLERLARDLSRLVR